MYQLTDHLTGITSELSIAWSNRSSLSSRTKNGVSPPPRYISLVKVISSVLLIKEVQQNKYLMNDLISEVAI